MSSTETRLQRRGVPDLASQDRLRLKVLATRTVRAIRIDEDGARLTALTEEGEASVPLTPGANPTRYYRALRDYLSDTFLNLPGGYPAHIGRWTRMTSLRRDPARLLLLGDPEAVMAVACAGDMDAALAADTWWSAQSLEIALALLRHEQAPGWPVAPELAVYVLEYLPFEERSATVTEALGRILQPGLLEASRVAGLWQRGRRRHTWRSGFFLGHPSLFPARIDDHPRLDELQLRLRNRGLENDPVSDLLLTYCRVEGRKTLAALRDALDKPGEQEVVSLVFRELDRRMNWPGYAGSAPRDLDSAAAMADSLVARLHQERPVLLQCLDDAAVDALRSLAALCVVSDEMLAPVFGGNTFSGTVMRRHLDPLLRWVGDAAAKVLDF